MVDFKTSIKKFKQNGEKTGWTYIEIPFDIAEKINPSVKKSYRVKGSLDFYKIEKTAILPMGEGSFILPLNATIRKNIKKRHGDVLHIKLELDKNELTLDKDFLDCLQEDNNSFDFFKSLTKGHQNYFSKWIQSAKTQETKAKRIANTLDALNKKMGYSEMIRYQQRLNKKKASFNCQYKIYF